MRILKTLSITASALALMPASFAQNGDTESIDLEKPEGPAEIRGVVQAQPIALFFAGLDTNRDKIITRIELNQGLDTDWRALRPSVTGKVGAFKIEDWALETLGHREAYPTRLSFDSNLDNQVSEAEFKDRLERTFADKDENNDGKLTRAELITIAAPRIIRKEARRDRRSESRDQQRQRRN